MLPLLWLEKLELVRNVEEKHIYPELPIPCSLGWMALAGGLWAEMLNIKNLLNCVQDPESR